MLGGNKNFLTISVISYMDYINSGVVSRLEEKKRMKAIDSNYKKIFYDKSKQKYNKEIFWGMVGALMASANIINGIKNIDSTNTVTLTRRK